VIDAAEPLLVGADVKALARINADALIDALGLKDLRRGRRLLRRLILRHTIDFAHTLAEYDALVGRRGLGPGAAWLLERFVGELLVSGQQHVPTTGPVLLLANHPGLSDTLALFASIPRNDLRVLAADRPFLRALPHTSERLVYLADSPQQRLSAMRGIAGHLRKGGAMLTFPAGAIEPDPGLRFCSALRLMGWEEPLQVLVRMAHDVPIVPAVVRGVLSPAAQRNPITRLRRRPYDRSWLGAVLQTMWAPYHKVTVHVSFGEPIEGDGQSDECVVGRVIATERSLMHSYQASS
jgi:1-acyl-sn-glycerol-3-phosphate acyltransferase